MRKIPTQVADQVGRLMRSGHMSSPPTWYAAVLANPPPQIAPRRSRTSNRLTETGQVVPTPRPVSPHASSMRASQNRPGQLHYREDRIRQAFFKDFPFEALRPTTLVELREVQSDHPVSREAWTSLAQRGAFPTVEDTIEFTLLLHDRGMPLTLAYRQATGEFVKLRARHEWAQMASELEARFHGAEFSETPAERHFRKEREYLDAHLEARKKEVQAVATSTRVKADKKKRWSTFVNPDALSHGGTEFTGGRSYVERWRTPYTVPEKDVSMETDGVFGDLSESETTESGFGDIFGSKNDNGGKQGSIDNLDFLRRSVSSGEKRD